MKHADLTRTGVTGSRGLKNADMSFAYEPRMTHQGCAFRSSSPSSRCRVEIPRVVFHRIRPKCFVSLLVALGPTPWHRGTDRFVCWLRIHPSLFNPRSWLRHRASLQEAKNGGQILWRTVSLVENGRKANSPQSHASCVLCYDT